MKYVPLISSGVAGSLGILHLPRLWQKVSLEARGLLADGYPGVGDGFDKMVIDGLGLSAEALVDFIAKERPTYPQFEAWVASRPGVKLDDGAVFELNDAISGYVHSDETRKAVLAADNLPDDAKAPKDAISLNNLDDWHEFHAAVLK